MNVTFSTILCTYYVYSPGQMPIRKMFPRLYFVLFGPHENMKLGFHFIHCLCSIFHSHHWRSPCAGLDRPQGSHISIKSARETSKIVSPMHLSP